MRRSTPTMRRSEPAATEADVEADVAVAVAPVPAATDQLLAGLVTGSAR